MPIQGRTIICTVGKSAIDNLVRYKSLVPEVEVQSLLDCFRDKGNYYKAKGLLLPMMQAYYQDKKYKDLWPAELTSLDTIKVSPQDEVIFVAGSRIGGLPDEGAVCAETLTEYYNTRPTAIPARLELAKGFVITPQIDPVTGEEIKNFDNAESMLETLDRLARDERKAGGPDKPIIFNVTPGYKPSVIYASLVGLVYGCELYYTQIDMTEPLVVPAIPTRVLSEESLSQSQYDEIKNTNIGKLYDAMPAESSSGSRYRRKKLLEIVDQMPRASKEKSMKVLFLSADPRDHSRLRLGKEYSEIDRKLRSSAEREKFDLLNPQLALSPDNIIQTLRENRPQIVHFSGHGDEAGQLYFESNDKSYPASTTALSGMFSRLKSQVQCVVLNACYSEAQARAIAEHIKYVIGMSKPISDGAAISFAKGFYTGLGAGKVDTETDLYEDAFQDGCSQIDFDNFIERNTPTFYKDGQLVYGQTASSSSSAGIDRFSFEVELEDEGEPSRVYGDEQAGDDLRDELKTVMVAAGYEVQTTRSDVLTLVGQIVQNANDHQTVLTALFGAAKAAIEGLVKLAAQREAKGQTIKISVEVDGQTITIETADVESAEKLATKFQAAHPTKAQLVTTNSKLKVKGRASKK